LARGGLVQREHGGGGGHGGGDGHTLVRELIELHYDPVYTKSMRRHFAQFEAAQAVELPDAAPATLAAAARALIDALPAPAAQA
jgi:tRNA 2-selenouridine synthase